MHLDFDPNGTPDALASQLARVGADPTVRAVLLLAADGNGFTPESIDPVLRGAPCPVYGGTFPQLLADGRPQERGTLAIGLPAVPRAVVVPSLSDVATDLERAVEPLLEDPASPQTIVVLVDGFARRISALVAALFDVFGLTHNVVGGGAGSLSMRQGPCLLTPQGMLTDAAVLLAMTQRSGVGVSHGWEIISEPLQVTRAHHTTIEELNFAPAFEEYRRIVEPHIDGTLTPGNFFDVAKAFPFGIRKLDGEVVVRDPLLVADGRHLVCVGEVPAGSFVHVLHGEQGRLVAAAAQAASAARDAHGDPAAPGVELVIDCISRALFLGDGYVAELDAMRGARPQVGALTLGEIANSGRDYLEFYNKTAVVAVLDAA